MSPTTKTWRFALPATEEIYEHVVSEGSRRRRLYQRILGGACVALVIAIATPFVLRSDNKPGRVVAAASDATTTSVVTTSVSSDSPTSTDLTAATGQGETTTAPVLVCRNSTKPACGPFRWDPPPAANQPVTATVSFAPQTPHVGDTVTFTVHGEDPDADITCVGLNFPQGVTAGEFCGTILIGCSVEPQGPWDAPVPTPSSVDRVYTHVFESSGAVTVPVDVTSIGGPLPHASDLPAGSSCPRIFDHDPFGGSMKLSIIVDVAP
jgi:hypothetical protein